jgi:hypothetical protein
MISPKINNLNSIKNKNIVYLVSKYSNSTWFWSKTGKKVTKAIAYTKIFLKQGKSLSIFINIEEKGLFGLLAKTRQKNGTNTLVNCHNDRSKGTPMPPWLPHKPHTHLAQLHHLQDQVRRGKEWVMGQGCTRICDCKIMAITITVIGSSTSSIKISDKLQT